MLRKPPPPARVYSIRKCSETFLAVVMARSARWQGGGGIREIGECAAAAKFSVPYLR